MISWFDRISQGFNESISEFDMPVNSGRYNSAPLLASLSGSGHHRGKRNQELELFSCCCFKFGQLCSAMKGR